MNRKGTLGVRLAILLAVCSCIFACKDQQTRTNAGDRAADSTLRPSNWHEKEAMDIGAQVAFAKQSLAERLQVDLADIEVETARSVNWRSGAAGCPKPGMSYTMAIVPGVLILLKADGETHHYHAGRGRAPFYCPPERVEGPAYGLGEEVM